MTRTATRDSRARCPPAPEARTTITSPLTLVRTCHCRASLALPYRSRTLHHSPEDIFEAFFGSARGGMGGMGGLGGMGGMGGSPFESMMGSGGFGMPGGASGSGMRFGGGGMGGMGGMPGGGFSGVPSRGPSPGSPPPKPAAIEVPLNVTLEELFSGVTKTRKLTRRVADPSGRVQSVEETLSIAVKKGWKAGTRITFEGKGDMLTPGAPAADIVFVLHELPHALFSRKGPDLVTWLPVSLADALGHAPMAVSVPGIDGTLVRVQLHPPLQQGAVVSVAKEGMPLSKSPVERGRLLIHLDVRMPVSLPEPQRVTAQTACRQGVYDLKRKTPEEYAA